MLYGTIYRSFVVSKGIKYFSIECLSKTTSSGNRQIKIGNTLHGTQYADFTIESGEIKTKKFTTTSTTLYIEIVVSSTTANSYFDNMIVME